MVKLSNYEASVVDKRVQNNSRLLSASDHISACEENGHHLKVLIILFKYSTLIADTQIDRIVMFVYKPGKKMRKNIVFPLRKDKNYIYFMDVVIVTK